MFLEFILQDFRVLIFPPHLEGPKLSSTLHQTKKHIRVMATNIFVASYEQPKYFHLQQCCLQYWTQKKFIIINCVINQLIK